MKSGAKITSARPEKGWEWSPAEQCGRTPEHRPRQQGMLLEQRAAQQGPAWGFGSVSVKVGTSLLAKPPADMRTPSLCRREKRKKKDNAPRQNLKRILNFHTKCCFSFQPLSRWGCPLNPAISKFCNFFSQKPIHCQSLGQTKQQRYLLQRQILYSADVSESEKQVTEEWAKHIELLQKKKPGYFFEYLFAYLHFGRTFQLINLHKCKKTPNQKRTFQR